MSDIEPSSPQSEPTYETRLYPLRPHLIAQSGDVYIVALDGTDNDSSVAIAFDNGRIGTPMILSALIESFPDASPFAGTTEERERIENAVRDSLIRFRRGGPFRRVLRWLKVHLAP